ncbi:MAG: VRR-NUC domain-containing protein [Candidatus Colwellbacteria bacterium]
MREPSEQEIQKSILEYLRIKKYVVFKHHSTGSTIRNGEAVFFSHGEKGISDIIACSPKGNFTAIEVKKRGGKPSTEQLEFIERVKANGGTAFVAYSFDDVYNEIEGIARRPVVSTKNNHRQSPTQ